MDGLFIMKLLSLFLLLLVAFVSVSTTRTFINVIRDVVELVKVYNMSLTVASIGVILCTVAWALCLYLAYLMINNIMILWSI